MKHHHGLLSSIQHPTPSSHTLQSEEGSKSIFSLAIRKALGGGLAGAAAMSMQVVFLLLLSISTYLTCCIHTLAYVFASISCYHGQLALLWPKTDKSVHIYYIYVLLVLSMDPFSSFLPPLSSPFFPSLRSHRSCGSIHVWTISTALALNSYLQWNHYIEMGVLEGKRVR